MTFSRSALAVALPAALLLCFGAPALAQSNANLAPANAMLRSSSSTDKEAVIGVGIGPRYLGSDKRQGYLGLGIEAGFGNGFFVSSQSGLGYRFLETPSGWSMAVSIGASPSRREKDGNDDRPNRLRGMGDIDAKVQANLFLNYDKGPFHANAALHQTLASRRGTGLDLSASYDLFADHDNLVRLDGGISYANRSLMQTFFGVTPAQSARSGNPTYAPAAGIGGGSVDLSWRHAFGEHWVGTVGAGLVHLRGPAADSPLTARRTAAAASVSLGYRF